MQTDRRTVKLRYLNLFAFIQRDLLPNYPLSDFIIKRLQNISCNFNNYSYIYFHGRSTGCCQSTGFFNIIPNVSRPLWFLPPVFCLIAVLFWKRCGWLSVVLWRVFKTILKVVVAIRILGVYSSLNRISVIF